MKFYPETYLPIECYRNAVTIGGRESLVFNNRNASDESLKALDNLASALINRHRHIKTMSVKEYKNYLSYIMLLPALVLGCHGQYLYKRDSFSIAKPLFSSSEWSVVDWASQQRLFWQPKGLYSSMIKMTCKVCPKYAPLMLQYIDYLIRKTHFFDRATRMRAFQLPENFASNTVDFANAAKRLARSDAS